MDQRHTALVLCLLTACDDDGGDPPDTSDTLISVADGGRLTSTDGVFTLVVPSGAVAEDTRISIRTVPEAEWPADASPLAGVYDLQPDGLQLQTPAFALHELATSAIRQDERIAFADHAMRSNDGEVDYSAPTMIFVRGDRATIAARIPHLSEHWTTFPSSGALNHEFATSIDAPLDPSYPIGNGPTTRSIELVTGYPMDVASTYVIAALVPQQQDTLVPVVHDGWGNTFNGFEAYLDKIDVGPLRGAFGGGDDLVFSVTKPFLAPAPLPAWRCDRAGTGIAYVAVTIEPFGKFHGLLEEVGTTSCTGDVTPGPSYTTLAQPEGIDLFHIGPNRPPGIFGLTVPGLPNGTYAAVAGGDAAGGLDLVHLGTGARTTNEFADVSPAYGVAAIQGANGAWWTIFGGAGTATAGWNNSAQTFGLTQLGLTDNTTQVATADTNADGTPDRVMTTASVFSILVTNADGSNAGAMDPSAFAGGNPGQWISAQFGRTADEALVVSGDGRVWFGPISGATDRMALVGSVGTSPRLASCAGSTPRVCAIAGYGDDKLYVVEIDAAGARIVGNIATGDAPIDPAVIMDGAVARIAMTGSADNSIEVFTYDPTSEALTVDRASAPIANCTGPNHVRWLDPDEGLVSCYGGGGLVRLHL